MHVIFDESNDLSLSKPLDEGDDLIVYKNPSNGQKELALQNKQAILNE